MARVEEIVHDPKWRELCRIMLNDHFVQQLIRYPIVVVVVVVVAAAAAAAAAAAVYNTFQMQPCFHYIKTNVRQIHILDSTS